MDRATQHMLEDIPAELTARGWRFVREESHPYRYDDVPSYVVAYKRRYDPETVELRRIDHRAMLHDGYVWVWTNTGPFASWRAARDEAITIMQQIDERRRDEKPLPKC
jgi:hypothetical protein